MINKINIDIDSKYNFSYNKEFQKIFKVFKKITRSKRNVSIDLWICNKKEMRKINFESRGIDKETDILSFPINNFVLPKTKNKSIGEIIICWEKIEDQAKEFGHSIKREFCYMFAHGLVHLSGRDHKLSDKDEVEFNLIVNLIMSKMNIRRNND